MSAKFTIPPSSLSHSEFLDRFGSIYEHSAWIAEAVWNKGLTEEHDSVGPLADALAAVLDASDDNAKLELIRAHPDLAGKAAVRGELTEASTSEQAGAGLDECSAEEFARFQTLNEAYKSKFGFPFILAVKGRDRHEILAAFENRLDNDQANEFQTAIEQIHQIARLRLSDL